MPERYVSRRRDGADWQQRESWPLALAAGRDHDLRDGTEMISRALLDPESNTHDAIELGRQLIL